MIDAYYVRQMARYNAWQNKQITDIVLEAPDAVLRKDQGAFFGSIFETLNHLLWGDTLWMSRFDASVEPPKVGPEGHRSLTPTVAAWSAERFQMDGAIRVWAQGLRNIDLTQDLTWYSGMTQQELSKPVATCVMHFFNHQTHHRGQVHAMLTAAGYNAPVSDLVFMPED